MPGDNPILAIDPGRYKCGLAVLDCQGAVLARMVVPLAELAVAIRELAREYPISRVVLGDRTGQEAVAKLVQAILPQAAIKLMDEHGTSLLARRRYFAENPPRGWRRLIPLTLQTPPESIDDWAAVILAERYIREGMIG